MYLYQADGDGTFKSYKFIQRYVLAGEDQIRWNPVLLAPIGKLYDDHHGLPSNRYVGWIKKLCLYI